MKEVERSGGSRGTPIFQAAVAIFCGSALGASGALPLGVARVLVLAAPVVGLALAQRKLRKGLTARGILLSLLVLGASLRAGVRTDGGSPSAEATALGTWRPLNGGNGGNGGGGGSDRDHGSIEGETPSFAFVHGTLAAGEEVAVLPGEGAPAFARGPEPGPSRAGGGPRSSRERTPDEVVRLGARDAGICDRAVAVLERARAALLERTALLGDPLTRGLVAGLLLGDLSELPRGVGDLFVRTGTFHILAISGLQVALVAVLLVGPIARALAFLLRTITRGRVRDGSQALSAILLLLFVPVAGAGPPVLRSALTFVVGSLAPRLRVSRRFDPSAGNSSAGDSSADDMSAGDMSAADAPASDQPGRRGHFMVRNSDPLSIWSLALVLECLVHPDAPLSASVQLTYAATFGLIVAAGPIRALLCRGLPNGGRLSATSSTGRTRPELPRILAQKVCDASIQAVAASLAAVLATLAVVWARFGEWSPVGVLATPAIAFPVAWMLVGGWIWLVAPSLVPQALLDVPGRAMIQLLEAFDRIPETPCEVPPRPFWLLLAACALTVLALARRRGRDGPAPSARAWSARGAALLWAAILVPWVCTPSSLEVHALDVGHGTAAVIRSPGGAVWIFDAGSRDRPDVDREALAPLLRACDATRIGIVLSHPDRDHDGAMGWLVERYPPALWAGALPAQVDARLPHTVLRADIWQGRMKLPSLDSEGTSEGTSAGSSGGDSGCGTLGLELSRGLDVAGNEGSRCLEITWRDDRIVLSGDAEAEGLAAWLAGRPRRGPVRMLLFPHHGSDTNLVGPLLAALRPTEIWISASGTPGIERELERREIRCRITSVEGPLELTLP